MNYSKTSLLVLLCAVLAFTGSGWAQSQLDIRRTATEVQREGIAIHALARDITWYNDFFSFDTLRLDTVLQRQADHDSLVYARGERPQTWTVDTTIGPLVGTASDTLTPIIVDSLGSWLELRTTRTGNSGIDVQLTNSPFRLEKWRPLYFETRFKLGNLDQTKFFIGLCSTATSPIDSIQSGVGLRLRTNDSNLCVITGDYIYPQAATGTISRDTNIAVKVFTDSLHILYAFEWDGDSTFRHYIMQGDTNKGLVMDSLLMLRVTHDSTKFHPTRGSPLKPTFCLRALADNNTSTVETPKLWVDYIYIRMSRFDRAMPPYSGWNIRDR